MALGGFVAKHFEDFRRLWSSPVPAYALWLLPPAWLAMTVLNSEILRQSLWALDVRLTVADGLALTLAAFAVNQFMPLKGGSGLRALYLATRRGVPLAGYLAVMAAVSVMTLTAASVFALIGLICLSAKGHEVSPALFGWFGAAAAGGPLAIMFLGRLPIRLPGPMKALAKGWDRVRSTPGLLWRLSWLQVVFFASWALVNWLTLAAFQASPSPWALMFYAAGQIHATLLNLTPAGLGLVEAISVLAGSVMDVTAAQVLSAQALSRMAAVAFLSILGTWGWLYLTRLGATAKSARLAADWAGPSQPEAPPAEPAGAELDPAQSSQTKPNQEKPGPAGPGSKDL
jgi:hypothetical protein